MTTINHLSVDQICLSSKLVRLCGTVAVDVENLVAVSRQVVGYQSAVALEVTSFRTHVRGAALFSNLLKIGNAFLEIARQHVVCIIAETLVSQAYVWRIIPDFLTITTERFQPLIPNVRVR